MASRLNIRIIGEVQGVFFRQSAKSEAECLALNGFARNEPDGLVYIEAEGEETALKEFMEWCHKGPKAAQIDEVTTKEDDAIGYKNFEIR